jgi:hypothetical protein
MSNVHFVQTSLLRPGRLAAVLLLAMGACGTDLMASQWESVMVYSENFNGYKRVRAHEGGYKPETFAFGEGGRMDRPIANNEVNELSFERVIKTLAIPLARQNYVPATDAKHTDLLILVYWGSTNGSNSSMLTMYDKWNVWSPALDSQDVLNARLLGYTSKLQQAYDLSYMSFAQDIFQEIRENRYFVVMQAFDFPVLWKEHKQKLLWETRFSISEQGNAFDEQLAGMAQRASQFFGNGNGKLVRRAFPKGRVEVGVPVEVKDQR